LLRLLNKVDKSKTSIAYLGTKKNKSGINVLPLTVGIETLGGITHKLITRNTAVPTRAADIFTTAEDNQSSVEIHVVAGEYEMVKDNITLGKFTLTGIPPAPRGVPQVEVTFEIDEDGAFFVSARELATNKQQSITTAFSPDLSAGDIERMIREAGNHAEEDKKNKQEIENRNKLDQLAYSLEKLVKENREKISSSLVDQVEKAVKKSKKAIESGDNDGILEEIENINRLTSALSIEMYKNR
jgi:molecular chaperone DnaK